MLYLGFFVRLFVNLAPGILEFIVVVG